MERSDEARRLDSLYSELGKLERRNQQLQAENTDQAEEIKRLKEELEKPPEDILICKCGWWGSIEQQDALGSECGCCPNCGNEDLVWLSKLQAENAEEIKQQKGYVKKYGNHHWKCPLNSINKTKEDVQSSKKTCNCGFDQALGKKGGK